MKKYNENEDKSNDESDGEGDKNDHIIPGEDFLKGIQAEATAPSLRDGISDNINSQNSGLFTSKPVNTWLEEAAKQAIPMRLFDDLWLEGETCFLFSDTNVGKSILAVQIADSITSGKPIPGFRMEAEPSTTLYFDLELSGKQFERRYSNNYENHYRFDEHFIRAEIDPSDSIDMGGDYSALFLKEVEREIERTGATRMILDNISFISSETEKATAAIPIMQGLKRLRDTFGMSILVLGHTPKRDLSRPLTQNDMAGSKALSNFIDSSFTIGRSGQGANLRYIKQLKVRSSEETYGADNVITCSVDKPHNFLGFERLEQAEEQEHLQSMGAAERTERNSKIVELHNKQPELSQRKLSEMLSIPKSTVHRVLARE